MQNLSDDDSVRAVEFTGPMIAKREGVRAGSEETECVGLLGENTARSK